MSTDETMTPVHEASSPTSVRHFVLASATLMAVLLYLDRYAVSIPLESIREDLRMTQNQKAWFISAFFWSYALCQVPAGWLSDRYGARVMLTAYIVCWSAATGLMGVAHSIWMLLWLRAICGASQAGAYPTAGGVVRQWYPVSVRGTASSIVGLGGRFGGVLAPILTASLIVYFVSTKPDPKITAGDIMNADAFIARFEPARELKDQKEPAVHRQQFVVSLLEDLPLTSREALQQFARDAEIRNLEAASNGSETGSIFDLKDWIPNTNSHTDNDKPLNNGLTEIIQALSERIGTADFHEFACRSIPSPLKLPGHATNLLSRRNAGTTLSESETIHLNRYVLETLFPAEVLKSRGQGWRETLVVYGLVGVFVALMFAIVVRNRPAQHPWCNAEEKGYINDAASQKQALLEPKNPSFPWRAFLTDISLWGNSATQFLTNVGWLFIVNSLPQYLEEVHGVSIVTKGFMTAFPMGAGILGLFSGGRMTDWAVRRFGLKRGRRIPLVGSRFVAAAGYGLCLLLSTLVTPSSENQSWLPWLYVGSLCIAAASTDFGTPALWAYCQDVGGQYTASILGWGNMWGNIGAAVAPLIYIRLLGKTPTITNWNSVFTVCCMVFVVSGFCAMLLDATKPLTVERPSQSDSTN